MSCPPPAKRYPRTLAESPAFDPAWRHLQVKEYLRCAQPLAAGEAKFILPSSERDSIVRANFKFRTDLPTAKAAAFRYAQECDETNARTAMSSRIKAMTVAKRTAAEIAARLHTCPENIEVFQKLFFDVADYVHDHEALGAILLPMTQQTLTADRRERVWLLAAYHLGVAGLDYVMDQRLKLSMEEQKEISESIHAILAEQSLSYALTLHGRPDAGPEVMDAYQKSLEVRLRSPAPEEDKARDFFKAVGNTLMEKVRRQNEDALLKSQNAGLAGVGSPRQTPAAE